MVRKGYKGITVREELYERLSLRARDVKKSVPEFIGWLLDQYDGLKGTVHEVVKQAPRVSSTVHEMVLPVACRGCTKTSVERCSIWQVQFRPFGRECPREEA